MHDDSELEKLVIFAIANYHLALPIEQVLRVINYPTDTSTALADIGLIRCGRHTIRLANLSQQLQIGGGIHANPPFPFLMLVRGVNHELCGIPVLTPPDVVELPTETIEPVEWSSAASPLLKAVSHTAVINQDDAVLSIFLLDLHRVLAAPTEKLLGTSLA